MSEHERRDPMDDGLIEVERSVHVVDPESELGRAMAKAREAGIAGPDDDFDEGSIRGTPVTR